MMETVQAAYWPQAILFDLDGTLIDTAPDIAASINIVLARDGLAALDLGDVRSMIGHGIRALVKKAYAASGCPIDEGTLDLREATMMSVYATHLTVLSRPMPGAVDALAACQARNAALAVVTNKPLGLTQTILRHFGIDGLFAATIGGDFGLAPKPAPAPLFAALGPLGVAPKDAIMVGDSATDVAAARAAGIPVVAVGGGYTDKPADELGADRALASLHGLGDLLDAWT